MNGNGTVIGEWHSLGGVPISRGDNDADVVFAHVSDLHGQLTPRHQVYYDNPTSGPALDFGEDDHVIVEYLEEHSLVETADDGGRAENTPADGPYPFIQPGVDYRAGEAYCETSMIPRGNAFPGGGRNRTR